MNTALEIKKDYYLPTNDYHFNIFFSDSTKQKASIISSYITEGTIFHMLNHERLATDKEKLQNTSFLYKVTYGVVSGVAELTKTICLAFFLKYAISFIRFENIQEVTESIPSFLIIAVLGPLIEEIIFRASLQNIIKLVQYGTTCITPNALQNNCIFTWLISPACRVTLATSLFAYGHLSNAGDILSTTDAILQATGILLAHRFSIIYETTGNFIVPLVAHMTNNAIVGVFISYF